MSTEVRQGKSSFLSGEGGDAQGTPSSSSARVNNSSENGLSPSALVIQQKNYPTLVSLITGTLQGGSFDSTETMYSTRDKRDCGNGQPSRVPTFEDIARKVCDKSGTKLDKK